jgi:hypothetical protein
MFSVLVRMWDKCVIDCSRTFPCFHRTVQILGKHAGFCAGFCGLYAGCLSKYVGAGVGAGSIFVKYAGAGLSAGFHVQNVRVRVWVRASH